MILRTIARMLIQEHRYRPITGRVLTLGPQTVPMTPAAVDALFAEPSSPDGRPIRGSQLRAGGGTQASIDYFFEKFGVERVESVDVVDTAGGTIVHDLNAPLPDHLAGHYDFVLDGGTFDHLVNLGNAFTSVVKLLKPGGRVFQYNAASNYIGAAYVSFGPDLFYDYYVLNRFADCKVYLAREVGRDVNSPWDVFYLKEGRTKELNCGRKQMVIVIAEKGPDSRADRIPVEYAYRDPVLREQFSAAQRIIARSPRPLLDGTIGLLPGLRERVRFMRREAADAAKLIRSGKVRPTSREGLSAGLQAFRKRRGKRTTYVYVGRI